MRNARFRCAVCEDMNKTGTLEACVPGKTDEQPAGNN